MKKILALILTLIMLPVVPAFAQEPEVTIVINDVIIDQTGPQKAIVKNETTMIPFRILFEALGAHVEWVQETKTIVATRGLTLLTLQIGNETIRLNGEEMGIVSAPEVMNETTLIPLRAISAMLEADVQWNQKTKTVYVKTERESRNVHTEYLVKEYKNDRGKTLVKAVASYPVFALRDNPVITDINKIYINSARDFADKVIKDYKKVAEENYEKAIAEEMIFEPFIAINQTEVLYDEGGFISIADQAVFMNGTLFDYGATTIDIQNGKIMKLEDFVVMGKEETAILSAYDFYINEGALVLFLTPESQPLYGEYNYPGSLQILDDYIIYDLKTGEKKATYKELSLTNGAQRISKECKTLEELNENLPFLMYHFKDTARNTPVKYSVEDSKIGEIEYSRDAGATEIIVRKAKGDYNLSGIDGGEKYQEDILYKNTVIKCYQKDTKAYATFIVDAGNAIYSYSIVVKKDFRFLLTQFAKEIIDKEKE